MCLPHVLRVFFVRMLKLSHYQQIAFVEESLCDRQFLALQKHFIHKYSNKIRSQKRIKSLTTVFECLRSYKNVTLCIIEGLHEMLSLMQLLVIVCFILLFANRGFAEAHRMHFFKEKTIMMLYSKLLLCPPKETLKRC